MLLVVVVERFDPLLSLSKRGVARARRRGGKNRRITATASRNPLPPYAQRSTTNRGGRCANSIELHILTFCTLFCNVNDRTSRKLDDVDSSRLFLVACSYYLISFTCRR